MEQRKNFIYCLCSVQKKNIFTKKQESGSPNKIQSTCALCGLFGSEKRAIELPNSIYIASALTCLRSSIVEFEMANASVFSKPTLQPNQQPPLKKVNFNVNSMFLLLTENNSEKEKNNSNVRITMYSK